MKKLIVDKKYDNKKLNIFLKDNILEGKNKNLDIIYEDENIILINKPINIEVTGKQSLTELVHKKYSNSLFLPMPCHRLDRNTSRINFIC